MMAFDPIMRPRLRHRGEEFKAVREKHQRPKVRDERTKWKLTYRDYSSGQPRRKSKVWMKSKVQTQREAQRLADKFMEEVNEANNAVGTEFHGKSSMGTTPAELNHETCTLSDLEKRGMELSWPLLKKSTRINYEFFFKSYLNRAFGDRRIADVTTMELQVFFNSVLGKLSPYTICNMHAALRSAFAQAMAWDLITKNPAVGVRLPKKKASKPTELLSIGEIKAVIERLQDPAKAVVTLIVFGSMRVGEALALRWNDILEDRIVIDERLYDGDLAEPKTLHGNRSIPFDQHGVLKETVTRIWNQTKFREARDFVFATRNGTPTERRNLLRHLKTGAKELKLPKTINFRNFRTMHASLMRRAGARAEITRDNMGHSETTTNRGDLLQNLVGRKGKRRFESSGLGLDSEEGGITDRPLDNSSPRMLFQPET